MNNILDIAPKEQEQLTTEYSIVDSIIADYEYEQVTEQLEELTREMAIAEQANIAIYEYENGLTTENSQSKLTKLYTDLNLREDQLEELTTEGASDIIEKIKAMIKKIWDQAKLMYQKLLTKAILYMDQSKNKAEQLLKLVKEEGYLVDEPKINSTGFENILTMFKEYNTTTVNTLTHFNPNITSPFALENLFFTGIKNKNFRELEALDNTKHFDIKPKIKDVDKMYILGAVGNNVPVLIYSKDTTYHADGSNIINHHSKPLGTKPMIRDNGLLKIITVEIPDNSNIKMTPLNRGALKHRLESYISAKFDLDKMKDLGRSDFIKDIKDLEENSDFGKKIARYAPVLTQANLIMIREVININKALMTMFALNIKMLRKEDPIVDKK